MVWQGGEAENGVAPVIATLLILALTIFMVAIFATVILNIGNTDAAPIAGVIISENNGVISLTHYSGATLHVGEYKILVNGVDQTNKFQPVGQDFPPGTKLTWDLGITQPLSHVSVVYTGEGKSVVIAEKKFNREGTAKANANFTASVTEGKNATSQVKTGVSGTRALPTTFGDQADIWVVLDSTSDQATVKFTAEESSGMVYLWTSGDGRTADTGVAEFRYDTAGSYTVRLDIRNTTTGEVGTSSMVVAVRNPGVTALAWIKRDSNIYGPIVARTTTGNTGISSDGNWAIQYNNPAYFGIEFKTMFTNGTKALPYHSRSKQTMVEGTWYHAAGVVNQYGLNKPGILKIYVDGADYSNVIPLSGDDPTGKTYVVSPSATIRLNATFNVSSYSEVPFPLSGGEIAFIHNAEIGYPR